MALWVKELGNEKLIKYVKEKGGIEMSKVKKEELGKQFWNKDGNKKGVKEIRELVLQGADLGTTFWVNNGYRYVWESLSFDEINEILKDLPKGYVIEGDVNLGNLNLTELPDFSKIKVGGSFVCYYNQLITLKGAPKEVGGDFISEGIDLCSLEGKPEKVGGRFYFDEEVLEALGVEDINKNDKNKGIIAKRDRREENKREMDKFMSELTVSMYDDFDL